MSRLIWFKELNVRVLRVVALDLELLQLAVSRERADVPKSPAAAKGGLTRFKPGHAASHAHPWLSDLRTLRSVNREQDPQGWARAFNAWHGHYEGEIKAMLAPFRNEPDFLKRELAVYRGFHKAWPRKDRVIEVEELFYQHAANALYPVPPTPGRGLLVLAKEGDATALANLRLRVRHITRTFERTAARKVPRNVLDGHVRAALTDAVKEARHLANFPDVFNQAFAERVKIPYGYLKGKPKPSPERS